MLVPEKGRKGELMISTVKENIYTCIKMNLDQVAMCVFGAMMVFCGAASGSDIILLCLSIFSAGLYLYLIYNMFYEMGQKDGIKIEAERLTYNKYKALWISLFANSLNFLLGILTVVSKALIKGADMFRTLSELSASEGAALSPQWAIEAFEILNIITKAIQCMYVGILKVCFSGNVFALLIIPMPAVITAVVAYRLGIKFCNGVRGSASKKERYKSK